MIPVASLNDCACIVKLDPLAASICDFGSYVKAVTCFLCSVLLADPIIDVVSVAAYNVEMKPSPIAASLKFRHGSTSDSAQEATKAMPGPADYAAVNQNLCSCNTVKGYSMGRR